MIVEMSSDGLWTIAFELSQFHGHGSWLVCEVALTTEADLHKVALSMDKNKAPGSDGFSFVPIYVLRCHWNIP